MYGNVHNIFLDHVDKHDNDSGYHHHHGPFEFDFIHHPTDECDNDDELPVTIHYGFGTDYIIYGPAHHTHDEPASESDDYDDGTYDDRDDGGNYHVATTTHPDDNDRPVTGHTVNYDYDIEWADNIDNVTGGDHYGHNKK